MPKDKTIFSDVPKCALCQERPRAKSSIGYKERCEHCTKYYNNAGEPFIIYKTTYVMRDKKGAEHWFWFFENRCCGAPIGYSKYRGLSLSEVLDGLDKSGHSVLNIQPPVMT